MSPLGGREEGRKIVQDGGIERKKTYNWGKQVHENKKAAASSDNMFAFGLQCRQTVCEYAQCWYIVAKQKKLC
jgi:hypothetical protein